MVANESQGCQLRLTDCQEMLQNPYNGIVLWGRKKMKVRSMIARIKHASWYEYPRRSPPLMKMHLWHCDEQSSAR